jgi:valyl-tRNA synthetase
MVKGRLQDDEARPLAQRVLAHTLDVLLRLLHPMIPFLTEEVWQRLGEIAPQRGIPTAEPAAESIMIAAWPEADASRRDERIEAQFALFQDVLRAVREIRSRQNVPSKTRIDFTTRCDADKAELLAAMEHYFEPMAGARPTGWGPDVEPPALSANVVLPGVEVFVDLAELIDVNAEIAKNEQEARKLDGFITGKKKKLENENFTSRAPAAVVEKEREGLAELEEKLAATKAALEALKKLGDQ